VAKAIRRLYRSGKERILGGVCGGIAEYFEVDPVLVRLLWVLMTLMWGAGIIMYLVAWIIIPRNPAHKWGRQRHQGRS
jgi:phage shock protein C